MAHVPATLSDFRARYPAFAAVPDETVQYWLDDAYDTTKDWECDEAAKAQMALAAHNLALAGYGAAGGEVGALAEMGVTSFKSASSSVSFAEGVVSARAGGGYSSTKYGKDFVGYLRRCRGGPRLVRYCA
jgi:hypothetical protein